MSTTETGAAANARFNALELASTNVQWLNDKEDDIIKAFGGGRQITAQSEAEKMHIKNSMHKARQSFEELLAKNPNAFGGLFKLSKSI